MAIVEEHTREAAGQAADRGRLGRQRQMAKS